MELVFKLTHGMVNVASLFSLVSFGQGGILALSNSTKERDTFKGKCETIELRCSTFMESTR